ncbi:MAG TPA: hypothetical protein VHY79_12890 [Rhizomicrobium sp.]|jgi:hypothetical protein|nr:hypothetical protein [Rhizomicrobium sp.]
MFDIWFRLFTEMTETSLAAQRVVALRMLRLAKGGAVAEREARRMVAEKVAAATEANLKIAQGVDLQGVVRHYGRVVRANERRLRRR